MTELLEQLRQWVEGIISSLGYIGIAFLMLLENLFPPIPSEFVLPFAGFLVADGEMSFVGVLTASSIGALAGALAIYAAGAVFNEDRTRYLFRQYGKYFLLSEDDFDQAMRLFEDHGRKMILLARLIPVVRSLISLPAGLQRMNLLSFSLLTALGVVIWNSILVGAGFWMGSNWEMVLNWFDTYENIVLVLLGVGALYFIVRRVATLVKLRR